MSSEQGKSLDWMYEGPTALVNREDYLLGRKVDKSFQLLEAAEKGTTNSWLSEAEKDLTPLSILKPGVGPTGAVDVVRKIKDDPLYQIQKKEQEYRKQLLQNPILIKKLKQQHAITSPGDDDQYDHTQKKAKKAKKVKKHKKKPKRSSSSESSSDEEVNKLLKTITNSKDIEKLLLDSATNRKSEESSHEEKKMSNRRKRHDSSSDDDDRRKHTQYNHHPSRPSPPRHRRHRSRSRSQSPRRSTAYRDTRDRVVRVHGTGGRNSRSYNNNSNRRSRTPPPSRGPRYERDRPRETDRKKISGLDEEEMQKRREEMMQNATQRDQERQRVVEKHREEVRKEHELLEKQRKTEKSATFINKQLAAAAESGSVEQRVKSNAYNIQRSKFAMDSNFARR